MINFKGGMIRIHRPRIHYQETECPVAGFGATLTLKHSKGVFNA